MTELSPLRRRMIDDMMIRNLSPATQQSYLVAAREPQRLPVVLSADEIVQFLEAVPGLRNRAALTTAYGAGLRAGEVARLETAAIDSRRMLIRVELGKGKPRTAT